MVLGASTAYERMNAGGVALEQERSRLALSKKTLRSGWRAYDAPWIFAPRTECSRPGAKLLRAPGAAEEGPAID